MATTEHTLKLQAVLDSRQVQQELQRLRQMQQKQTNQVYTGNNSSITNNSSFQATGKLDIQIQGLSKNISILTTTIQRLNSFNTQNSTKSNIPTAIVPGNSKLGQSMQKLFEKQLDETIFKTISKNGKGLTSEGFEDLMRTPIKDDSLYSNRLKRFREIVGENTTYKEFLKTIESPEFKALEQNKPKYNKEMMKFMGGMALQQVLTSAADYMHTSENPNVVKSAYALQAGSKVGGYALMGSSVGGLYGALAGSALGAIESLFDTLTARAKETREEINRQWGIEQSLKKGTVEFLQDSKDYAKKKSYEDAFEALSEEYNTEPLSKQIESLIQRREFVRSRLDVFENMSSQGFLGEQDLKSAKEMQQELVELDNKIKASTNTLKNYSQALYNLKEADEYQESTRKLFKTGSLADIQSVYEQIKIIRDEAMSSGNIRDIQKYNPRMRSYEQQIERIREIQTQSELDLKRMDLSYQNSRILERYGIGGGRGLRETLMTYGRKAVGERNRYEQLIKEGKLEEAAKARDSWQFVVGERNSLADQLLQVLGNRTADLTNVTSLASIGLGMGEVNDNFDRQMKVWEDQRDLQRDIKNILNEKTFSATYGE